MSELQKYDCASHLARPLLEKAYKKMYKPAAWWTNLCDVSRLEAEMGISFSCPLSVMCNVSVSAVCASWKNDLIRLECL